MICSSVNRDRLMSASFRRTLPKSGGNLGSQVTMVSNFRLDVRETDAPFLAGTSNNCSANCLDPGVDARSSRVDQAQCYLEPTAQRTQWCVVPSCFSGFCLREA